MAGTGIRNRSPWIGPVIVLTAWLLSAGTALSGSFGGVASAVDSADSQVHLPFSCPAGAVELAVTGTAEPARVVDGGSVDVTFTMRLPASEVMDGAAAVLVSQPLPPAITSVASVAFSDTEGITGTDWLAESGTLTVILEPERATPPPDLSVTVVATVRLGSGLAPASVAIATPDRLVIDMGPDHDPRLRPCDPDGPGTTLVTVTVVPPGPDDPPRPPDPPVTTPVPPVVPGVSGPDPAAGGDAPSPPPLTEDEIPTLPPSPDPGTASQVIDADVDGARERLADSLALQGAADDRVETLSGRSERLEADERDLEAERIQLATAIDRARSDLGRFVTQVYAGTMDGDLDFDPASTEAALMWLVVDSLKATCDRLASQQADVLDELGHVASDRAARQVSLDRASAERRQLVSRVADRRHELNTFLGGGDVAVTGFRFVVGGTHSFTDTWHAPRAGGRQHQGTDIFAAEGTPLYAAERGALARVGTDELGGTKLWLVGESGTHYYYAHLSGYGAGVADGVVVEAGQEIGYVGHTGDARTTPPHLHFEAHPGGGSAVNSYPMLVAADTGAAAPVVEPSAGATEPTEADGPDATRPAVTSDRDARADADDVGDAEVGPVVGGGAAVDGSGNRYVVDADRDRVQVLDRNGTVTAEWGRTGSADGRFRDPMGIAVGPDGTVYVADTHNNRIQTFTAAGRFLAAWGSTGTRAGQFNHPTGVAVDDSGAVYVADSYNNRIQVFGAAGDHRDSWGALGPEDGRFANPSDVVVGADGEVYVADTFNGRVQRFTPSGRFVDSFGSWVPAEGMLQHPVAVEVADDGTVWVADLADDQIRQFDESGPFLRAWDRAELTAVTDGRVPEQAVALAGG